MLDTETDHCLLFLCALCVSAVKKEDLRPKLEHHDISRKNTAFPRDHHVS